MKTNIGNLLRAYNSKGVSYHPLCLAETQKQAGERENFIVEKGKALGVLWLEVVDMG